MQQWEYCKWDYNTLMGSLEGNLNALGQAGWELVAIHVADAVTAKYIFKRPKQ